MFNVKHVALALTLSASAFSSHATITITQPGTSHVDLRTDCTGSPNCADNLPELLQWVWNTRQPSASDPLVIDIGPGIYTTLPESSIGVGSFCRNTGWVTFRGAGRENTVLQGTGSLSTIDVLNCSQLAFQDLTIDTTGSLYGYYWSGSGSSSYSNVTLTGDHWVWYDISCGVEPSIHHWTGSRLHSEKRSGKSTAYFSRCAESWFYGSELVSHADSGINRLVTIENHGGEIHVYGGVIRAIAEVGVIANGRDPHISAVITTANGETHIHGTGIDVISAEDNEISSLTATSGGLIHAAQSSYILKNGAGGTSSRINNSGGTVQAPYLWQSSSTPPVINSAHGADMVMITSTADNQPHLLVYSDNCTSNWYDTSAQACIP